MTATKNFLAFDLGASGGRAIIGRFDGEQLALDEAHRFSNGPTQLPLANGTGLFWDILRLFGEIKEGLAKAVTCCGGDLVSLGLDTWGVDFGLLDKAGVLLGNPYHYRDSRTDGIMDEAFHRVPRPELFAATGIQFMQINTLFQLLAMAVHKDAALDAAHTFLMVPDLLNYWLTGRAVSEYTIASTTQFLDPITRDWARPLLARLGLPTHILPPIVEPGTMLGELLPHVADEAGGRDLAVVAPACHDTAAAVAAVPAAGSDFAYLSSGTWSLIGAETRQPVIDERSLAFNFTNEGGVCGAIRLLKNITGLWIIQESRRTWASQGHALSWDDITRLAAQAPAFTALIDVDARDFASPGDMPGRVRDYCARTGQPLPDGIGAVARVVYESLALKYRWVLERLEELVGRRLEPLHIVGGGAKNRLLNQFTADAIGRPVMAGPVEATAAGNLLMQLLATGHIASLAQGRDLIHRSLGAEVYEPQPSAAWEDAYGRFSGLVA
ncbi:MAG: rhamnulokinase [Chloroflexi bacterium HGW-Chloroflexi-1]|nr:MAG: rhamnulokinase [Chloroflexi bacterium HGW-Chloroflexi-1]